MGFPETWHETPHVTFVPGGDTKVLVEVNYYIFSLFLILAVGS